MKPSNECLEGKPKEVFIFPPVHHSPKTYQLHHPQTQNSTPSNLHLLGHFMIYVLISCLLLSGASPPAFLKCLTPLCSALSSNEKFNLKFLVTVGFPARVAIQGGWSVLIQKPKRSTNLNSESVYQSLRIGQRGQVLSNKISKKNSIIWGARNEDMQSYQAFNRI